MLLSQRREVLDDVETITTYALDLSMLHAPQRERVDGAQSPHRELREGDRCHARQRRGALHDRYTIPMPEDSPIPGRDAEEMALNGSVLSTVKFGGACRTRTGDLSLAKRALSQLS